MRHPARADANIRSWYRGHLPHGRQSPLELLMIQSTRFCNINCSYCYLPHRNSKSRFDLDLLPALLKQLKQAHLLYGDITMLWHAGEPLVLPPAYYERAIKIASANQPQTCRFRHNFQTNATLLTDEYIDLIKTYGVSVGVSMDGPRELHDRNRVTRAGEGTFDKAMQGVDRIRQAGIPFTAICVLTIESLDHADDIYAFFKQLGCVSIGFNIDELEAVHTTTTMAGREAEDKYKSFLKRIHQLVLNDRRPLRIREFEEVSEHLAGSFFARETRSTENNPLSIISVDADGYIYTFSPEFVDIESKKYNNFKIGHVNEIDFKKLYFQDTFSKINQDIQQGVDQCRQTCSYFDTCGGGTPSNKYFENNDLISTETNFCRFKKKLFVDTIHEILQEQHVERLKDEARQ